MIPKFVGAWIKETSATGYLRGTARPNKREQDLPKVDLLCSECEERFSTWERQFATNLFRPLLNEHARRFSYGEWLLPFVVSVSFRVGLVGAGNFNSRMPGHLHTVMAHLQNWRAFLLAPENCAPQGRHYLRFLPQAVYIAEGMEGPAGVNWYMQRGVDMTLGVLGTTPCVYWKIPGIAGFSSLSWEQIPGMAKAEVRRQQGVFRIPQPCNAEDLDQLVLSRSAATGRIRNGMSSRQKERVEADYMKNMDEWMDSPAVMTALQDGEPED